MNNEDLNKINMKFLWASNMGGSKESKGLPLLVWEVYELGEMKMLKGISTLKDR